MLAQVADCDVHGQSLTLRGATRSLDCFDEPLVGDATLSLGYDELLRSANRSFLPLPMGNSGCGCRHQYDLLGHLSPRRVSL